jgi:hypothetical protein
MSARFPGSVVLLQEGVGVSCYQILVPQLTIINKRSKLTRDGCCS